MTDQVFLTTLHAISCIPLIVAARYWERRRRTENGAYRFLIPYLAPAVFFGVVSFIVPIAMMVIFKLMYGIHDFIHLNGFSDWLSLLVSPLPLLPAFCIIPAIGRKPRLVAGAALLSMCYSVLFLIYYNLIRNP